MKSRYNVRFHLTIVYCTLSSWIQIEKKNVGTWYDYKTRTIGPFNTLYKFISTNVFVYLNIFLKNPLKLYTYLAFFNFKILINFFYENP